MFTSVLRQYFRTDFATLVEEFSHELSSILVEWDVVVFVARRAMSLYDALVAFGYIAPGDNRLKVVSSRAIRYANCDLSKKRVAIIDDVMTTGMSMKNNGRLVCGQENTCMGLVAAQCVDDTAAIAAKTGFYTKILRTLEKSDAYELTREINDFVQAAGLLNNIDQPEFELALGEGLDLRDVLKGHRWFDCTTSTQSEAGYLSATITYDVRTLPYDLPAAIAASDDCLAKVRVTSRIGSGKARLLPFVILPNLTNDQLEDVYDNIVPDGLVRNLARANPLCDNDAELAKNRLRIVQYLLSWQLGNSVVESLGIAGAQVLTWRERLLFGVPISTDGLVDALGASSCQNAELEVCKPSVAHYASFMQHIRARFLRRHMPLPEGEDDTVFTTVGKLREEVSKSAPPVDCGGKSVVSIASVCLDNMIDCGILVPYIHDEGGLYIRAFRSGEIEQLSKRQMKVFSRVVVNCLKTLRRKHLPCTTINRLGVLFAREIYRADLTNNGDESNLLVFSYSEENGLRRYDDYRPHATQLLGTILASDGLLRVVTGKTDRVELTGEAPDPGFALTTKERVLFEATSKHFSDYLRAARTDVARDELLDTLIMYGSCRYVLGRVGTKLRHVCEKIADVADAGARADGKRCDPLQDAVDELEMTCEWATWDVSRCVGHETLVQEFKRVFGLLAKKYTELDLTSNTKDQYTLPADSSMVNDFIRGVGQFGKVSTQLLDLVASGGESAWLPVARRLLGRGEVLAEQIRTLLGVHSTLARQFSIYSRRIGAVTYVCGNGSMGRSGGYYRLHPYSDNRIVEFTIDGFVGQQPDDSCGILAVAFDLGDDAPYDIMWRGEHHVWDAVGEEERTRSMYPSSMRDVVKRLASEYTQCGVRHLAIVHGGKTECTDSDFACMFPCSEGLELRVEKRLEVSRQISEAFRMCGAEVSLCSYSIRRSDSL